MNSGLTDYRTKIFGVVTGGFVESHTVQLATLDVWFDLLPEGNRQILGGGDDVAQEGNFLVQIAMIALVHHGLIQNLFQLLDSRKTRYSLFLAHEGSMKSWRGNKFPALRMH